MGNYFPVLPESWVFCLGLIEFQHSNSLELTVFIIKCNFWSSSTFCFICKNYVWSYIRCSGMKAKNSLEKRGNRLGIKISKYYEKEIIKCNTSPFLWSDSGSWCSMLTTVFRSQWPLENCQAGTRQMLSSMSLVLYAKMNKAQIFPQVISFNIIVIPGAKFNCKICSPDSKVASHR